MRSVCTPLIRAQIRKSRN